MSLCMKTNALHGPKLRRCLEQLSIHFLPFVKLFILFHINYLNVWAFKTLNLMGITHTGYISTFHITKNLLVIQHFWLDNKVSVSVLTSLIRLLRWKVRVDLISKKLLSSSSWTLTGAILLYDWKNTINATLPRMQVTQCSTIFRFLLFLFQALH